MQAKRHGDAPSPADVAKKIERQLDRLAASIQQFRIDSQRFFAGDLPLPPDELRERLIAELRRLRSANLKGAAATFRLGSLEAQLNSHLDLFTRRQREREQGPRRIAEQGPSLADPETGVLVGRKAERGAVEALYKGLYLKSGTRNPKMDLERFRSYLDRQAEVIRSKTGCEEIQFRIAAQDGKMKLKARPIRRKTST